MKKTLLLLSLFICQSLAIISQTTSASCITAAPICSGTPTTYPSTYGSLMAEAGPNYGCLGSQNNPAWFYFKVDSSGPIAIDISQFDLGGAPVDVDFICWGPFSSPTVPCSGGLSGTALDCSYSTSAVEVVNVNGTAGNYYLLMITNFSNLPANVTFSVNPSSIGELSCSESCVTNAYHNSPLCVNGTLQLMATNHIGTGSYSWTGPGGFSSTLENPTLPSVTVANDGYYYVNYTRDSTCNYIDSVYVQVDTCGTLTGNVFGDGNSNCLMDATDSIVQMVQLKLSSGSAFVDFAWTDPFGYYYFNVLPGTYTIEVVPSPANPITCTSSLPHTTTVSASTVTTENFAVDCNSFDLAANWIGVSGMAFFPGTSHQMYPCVSRVGANCSGSPLPGEMIMVLDPLISYTGPGIGSTAPTSVVPASTGDTLKWAIPDINFTYFGYYDHYFTYTTSTSATIGDTVDVTLMFLPLAGDVNPINNVFEGHYIVGNSYDPNNKEVSPKGSGTAGFIPASTSELTYTVNFQNTGTAPAINIYILDTLQPNVDVSTLEILSSSHPMSVTLLSGNVLKFTFSNIFLADSTSNEPESHGFLRYRISPIAGLNPGDEIKNTAYIYFDYNPPIVTNTALNTIEFPFSVQEYGNYQLGVFPNPTTNSVNIVFEDKLSNELNLRVMNVAGQIIYEEKAKGFNGSYITSVDLNNAAQGIYLLEIRTNKQIVHKKILKN